MPYIIVIDKTGNVKEMNIKEYKESDLFKKANFKSPEGFMCHTKWSIQQNSEILVYGKTSGKAGQENKYEFPPPIDTLLFFGGCVLTNFSKEKNTIIDLRVSNWNMIYDKLMGGFEDLEEDDDEEEEEEPNGIKLSKDGYMCDDFIVDDDDDVDYDNISLEEDEEENITEKKKPKKNIVKRKGKSTVKKITIKELDLPTVDIEVLNTLTCESELSEEEYL